MSAKEQKPQLGGTRLRQRKRNINVPLDHTSFADDVVAIFQDAAVEGADVETNLLAGVKALEVAGADLDYSRYGDTLFELLFTGGRYGGGGTEVEYGESMLATNVFACNAEVAEIKPYVVAMQHILRRRPFLVKNLENTVKKLLQLLEHYDARVRDKIALAVAQVFSQRLGVPPENVFTVLLNDVMVAKGTTLGFVTALFRGWLRDAPLDELVGVLRRARVEDRLLEFFPQQRRSADAFAAHFEAEGLGELVAHSRKRFADARAKELTEALGELIGEGGSVAEALDTLKAKRSKDGGVPEPELVAAVWGAVAGGADTAGKAPQQAASALVKQLRAWAKLLAAAAGTKKAELELLYRVQASCYDDPALLKAFPEAVRHLYDKDVVSEETVMLWYRKGAPNKGRAVFVKELEPFVNWLQEAEEESDADDPTPPAAAAAAV